MGRERRAHLQEENRPGAKRERFSRAEKTRIYVVIRNVEALAVSVSKALYAWMDSAWSPPVNLNARGKNVVPMDAVPCVEPAKAVKIAREPVFVFPWSASLNARGKNAGMTVAEGIVALALKVRFVKTFCASIPLFASPIARIFNAAMMVVAGIVEPVRKTGTVWKGLVNSCAKRIVPENNAALMAVEVSAEPVQRGRIVLLNSNAKQRGASPSVETKSVETTVAEACAGSVWEMGTAMMVSVWPHWTDVPLRVVRAVMAVDARSVSAITFHPVVMCNGRKIV